MVVVLHVGKGAGQHGVIASPHTGDLLGQDSEPTRIRRLQGERGLRQEKERFKGRSLQQLDRPRIDGLRDPSLVSLPEFINHLAERPA